MRVKSSFHFLLFIIGLALTFEFVMAVEQKQSDILYKMNDDIKHSAYDEYNSPYIENSNNKEAPIIDNKKGANSRAPASISEEYESEIFYKQQTERW